MTYIRKIQLPMTVRGFTVEDQDGNFNIYINQDLSDEAMRKACVHELYHVYNYDFVSNKPLDEIERIARGVAHEEP